VPVCHVANTVAARGRPQTTNHGEDSARSFSCLCVSPHDSAAPRCGTHICFSPPSRRGSWSFHFPWRAGRRADEGAAGRTAHGDKSTKRRRREKRKRRKEGEATVEERIATQSSNMSVARGKSLDDLIKEEQKKKKVRVRVCGDAVVRWCGGAVAHRKEEGEGGQSETKE